MDAKEVGARIAAFRKARNLTQQQLADNISVTNKAVSKWETGDGLPDISILPALAGALDCSIDELLLGSKKPQPPKMLDVRPFVAVYAMLAVVLAFIIYQPGTGLPSLLDPASFLFLWAFALPLSYLFMWLRRSKEYLSCLIVFGLPVASGIVFLLSLWLMSPSSYDSVTYLQHAYRVCLLPFFYATFFAALLFAISALRKYSGKKKVRLGEAGA